MVMWAYGPPFKYGMAKHTRRETGFSRQALPKNRPWLRNRTHAERRSRWFTRKRKYRALKPLEHFIEGLYLVLHLEFFIHLVYVLPYRAQADVELVGNFFVEQAFGE